MKNLTIIFYITIFIIFQVGKLEASPHVEISKADILEFDNKNIKEKNTFLKKNPKWLSKELILLLIVNSGKVSTENIDEAFSFLESAKFIADKISDSEMLAEVSYQLARLNILIDNDDEAKTNLETALETYKLLKKVPYQQDVLLSLGALSIRKNDLDKGIFYYESVIDLQSKGGAIDRTAGALQVLTQLINTRLEDKVKALEIAEKSIKLYSEMKGKEVGIKLLSVYINAANLAIKLKNHKLARQYLSNAQNIINVLNPSLLTIMFNDVQGSLLVAEENKSESIKHFERAIELYEQENWKKEINYLKKEYSFIIPDNLVIRHYINSLTHISIYSVPLGQYRKARKAVKKLIFFAKKEDNPELLSSLLRQLAFIERSSGNNKLAKKIEEKTLLVLTDKNKQKEMEELLSYDKDELAFRDFNSRNSKVYIASYSYEKTKAILDIWAEANKYLKENEIEKFLDKGDKALQRAKRDKQRFATQLIAKKLGDIYSKNGLLKAAKEKYRDVIISSHSGIVASSLAKSYIDMARIDSALGDNKTSLDYYEQAILLLEKSIERGREAFKNNELSDYLSSSLEESIREERILLADALSEHSILIITDKFGNAIIENIYNKNKEQFQIAIELQERALTIHRDYDIKNSIAVDLYHLAGLYLHSKPKYAEELSQESILITEKLLENNSTSDLINSAISRHYIVAQTMLRNQSKNKNKIVDSLYKAHQYFLELASAGYYNKKASKETIMLSRSIYETIAFLAENSNTSSKEKSLLMSDFYKTHIAQNKLMTTRISEDLMLSNMVRELRIIKNILSVADSQNNTYETKGKSSLVKNDFNLRHDSIKSVRNRYIELKYTLNKISNTKIKASSSISIEKIRNKLLKNKNDVIISYFIGHDYFYSWILTKNKIQLKKILSKNELNSLVGLYVEKISNLDDNFDEYKLGRLLYNVLLEPFENSITSDSKITIVPDGILHKLPFEALIASSNSKKPKYFIEKTKSVRYIPSLHLALELIKEKNILSPSTDIHVIGVSNFSKSLFSQWISTLPDLPFVKQEIEGITNIYPNAHIKINKQVNEKDIKNLIEKGTGILHIASHTFTNTNFQHSGIVLGTGGIESEDGLLTYAELQQFGQIKFDLVTLSACQTIGNIISDGEGPTGLANTFLINGVPSVIASLWSVNDASTSTLMTQLYKKIQMGYDTDYALTVVKKAMLGSTHKSKNNSSRGVLGSQDISVGFRDPFYWAAFIHYGI